MERHALSTTTANETSAAHFITLGGRGIDISGQKFGRLQVQGPVERRPYPSGGSMILWLCSCDCGNHTKVAGGKLKSGHTTSCGCAVGGKVQHGHGSHRKGISPEYYAWQAMRKRCLNPNDKNYVRYGGRGITVCSAWTTDFPMFFRDMGPRPTTDHTLDRIDVNGNYEPSNCRWATQGEQQNNRRNNVMIEAFGRRMTRAEWAKETGIDYGVIRHRIATGQSPEDALREHATQLRKE